MISDLILIAKKFSVPSAYGRRDGVRDFFAQYPDGVYIATDAGAPAGWEGYAVWFGGTGERYAERFMELIRDGYIVERFLRARVGGLLVFTFRCRLKMRRFGTLGKPYGGASPLDKWWGLKLTMPNGGNVILRKIGSPTAVNLEVSTDAVHWSAWELVGTDYTYALSAGQTLCIRNTSETATGFCTSSNDYWHFVLDSNTYASGSVQSLLCKTVTDGIVTNNCFYYLFNNQTHLIEQPELPAKTISVGAYQFMFNGCSNLSVTKPIEALSLPASACYFMYSGCTSMVAAPDIKATQVSGYALSRMFNGCSSLVKTPLLKATSLPSGACIRMFSDCTSLNEVKILTTTLEAADSITNWLYNVAATGDFYCPASLTIPTGTSGIPTGWTRHDI